jgi:hypothetical protein
MIPGPEDRLILEFDGEMLVAQANITAYRKMYILEGWLRRICIAAWMAKFGFSWDQEIDSRIKNTIQRRIDGNRQRLYLGAESSNDLISQSTHAELLQMLTSDKVAATVTALTGATPSFLSMKLNEARDIRNLLAHNHALSERTYVILSGILASLEEAVNTFKDRVLYSQDSEIFWGDDHPLSSYLDCLLSENDWSKFQAFVGRRGDFLEYWSLPAAFETRPPWPDAQKLLYVYRDHLDNIVAFCLNKTGHEFGILTPMILSLISHEHLCDTFVKHQNTWTEVHFEEQNPRFICNSKFWFYENESRLPRA